MLLAFWAARRRRRDLRRLFGDRVEAVVAPGLEARRAWAITLVLLGVAACVFAAAQPRWGFTWRDIESRGVEIVVALDLSRSMDAQDVDPSRLTRARREVVDLVQELHGDRVGLVVFAGGAYPRVPLTVDYDALLHIVESCETSTLLAQGSSLDSAISTSLELLGEPGEADQAIVVLSDGEDHTEGLDEVIAEAKDAGVRIYAVGIGTDRGAPVPRADGGFVSYSGEVVVSRLQEDALRELAAGTGGAYVRSSAGASDVKGLAADLHAALTRQAIEVRREKVWDERYQWPLGFGLALIVLGMGLGDGRKRSAVLLALLLVAAPARASETELGPAELLMSQGRYDEAVTELERLQAEDPLDPQIAWALAGARYGAGDATGAARDFEDLAERMPEEADRIEALYNAGNARYRAGELEEAVGDWQQVLAQEPEHEAAQQNAERVGQEILRRTQDPPDEQPGQGDGGEGQQQDGQPGGDTGESSEGSESSEGESSDGTNKHEGRDGEPGRDSGLEQLDEALQSGEPGADSEDPGTARPYGVEEMSEEEARRLLDGVDEGTPRVTVRGQSSGKDW
jgi:Ca-activated chloride channel family protein